MREKSRANVLVSAPQSPHAHMVRVVHQIPQRVRLRPHAGRWSHEQCDRLAAALRRTASVQSFRLSQSGHSLTVLHSGPLQAVLSSVVAAIAPAPPAVPAPSEARRTREVRARKDHRAARRLLLCAIAGLAIALLPEPAAPAMIALRLLACAITAAVRHHAEQRARPSGLTRLLDGLALLAGLARADHVVRALLKHCAEWVLKGWAEARLREAFSAA